MKDRIDLTKERKEKTLFVFLRNKTKKITEDGEIEISQYTFYKSVISFLNSRQTHIESKVRDSKFNTCLNT